MNSNSPNLQKSLVLLLMKAKDLYKKHNKEENREEELIQHVGNTLKKATIKETGQDYRISSFYREKQPDLILQNPNESNSYIIELKILNKNHSWAVEEAFVEIYLSKREKKEQNKTYLDKKFLVLVWNELNNLDLDKYNGERIAKNLLNVLNAYECGSVEYNEYKVDNENTNNLKNVAEKIVKKITADNVEYAYIEVLQDEFRVATWKPKTTKQDNIDSPENHVKKNMSN